MIHKCWVWTVAGGGDNNPAHHVHDLILINCIACTKAHPTHPLASEDPPHRGYNLTLSSAMTEDKDSSSDMESSRYVPVRKASIDVVPILHKKRSRLEVENGYEAVGRTDEKELSLNIYDLTESSLHDHDHEAQTNQRKLMLAIALCLSLFCIELIGGWLSQSLAVMADACHMLTDVATYSVSFFAVYLGRKSPTKRMTFGYHRAEVLGAMFAVIIIWMLAAMLVMEAWERLTTSREVKVDGRVMLALALLSLAMNGSLLFYFGHGHHGHSRSHSHGNSHAHVHSHEDQPETIDHAHEHDDKDHKQLSINIRAAMLHALGDLVCSCGVVLSSILIIVDPSWSFVDALSTIFFSGVVVFTTLNIVKDIFTVLMEAVPDQFDCDDVEQAIRESTEGISDVHDLRIWSLSSAKVVMTAHVATLSGYESDKVLRSVQAILRRKFDFYHVTIQIESGMEVCLSLSHSQFRSSVDSEL
ncbi:cation efflux family-domain-containing protein [Cladochytrium replicatum]|nr:cation efflux family-domain-containing protein [Cladochytrium replicatum]